MRRQKLTKGQIRTKVVLWSIVLVMAAAVFITPFSQAATIEDYQYQLNQKKNQQEQVQQQLNQEKKNLEDVQAEIRSLDQKIYASQVELQELTKDLNKTKEDIAAALEELEQLQKDIEKQNDDLNARLRSMYKNGDVGMLSVLFGSSSMSDFMTNMDMVERVYNADAELLEGLEDQYDVVDEQKNKLQALKDQLIVQQEAVSAKKAALEEDKAEVEQKRKDVQADVDSLAAQYAAVKKEADNLTETIKVLQSANTQYIGG
ncbi:MAG: hypothetical protein IKN20_03215, partial [Firmicutes bacterium]|nr:hypothetical protein [Bacillota bacterium]